MGDSCWCMDQLSNSKLDKVSMGLRVIFKEFVRKIKFRTVRGIETRTMYHNYITVNLELCSWHAIISTLRRFHFLS